jgi:uncharacterized SAM-binding protein YcdF (DUF218 family)
MNELFVTLGVESWKPAVTTLLLPPVPLLLLVLIGTRLVSRRRWLGWSLVLTGVLALYLMVTEAGSNALMRLLTQPPPPLDAAQIAEIKRAPKTAIVVLGGGRRTLAPEYGMSSLKSRTVERLRYGIWLSRETALPLAFAGGVGHGAVEGPSEAEIAARVAEREFGRPLRWTEGQSRDTRENALKILPLLRAQGIDTVVVVTHDYHMRRSVRNFRRAAGESPLTVIAAPMGVPRPGRLTLSDWLPNAEAYELSVIALHEWLGWLAGA